MAKPLNPAELLNALCELDKLRPSQITEAA